MGKSVFHIFESEADLRKFIVEADPMRDFAPVKKEIIYRTVEKNCVLCSTPFILKHPAELYCEKCQTMKNKKKNSEAVPKKIKKEPDIKNCNKCDSEFIRTSPGMKKCKKCSKKGGELVNNK